MQVMGNPTTIIKKDKTDKKRIRNIVKQHFTMLANLSCGARFVFISNSSKERN